MSTQRPLIAVTTSYKGNRETGSANGGSFYLKSIWQSGGIPVVVAWTREDDTTIDEYINAFDGFLFSGGADVNPTRYGQSVMHDSVSVSDERDEFEIAMCKKALESGKPIFGICRGIQLINVAMGGTLHQHIEGHRQEDASATYAHTIRIVEGSHLYELFGSEAVEVNTFHHQAVCEVAPGLYAVAYNGDGYIEAVQSHAVMPYGVQVEAVQWHPERMFSKDAASKVLIGNFVERVALSKKLRKD